MELPVWCIMMWPAALPATRCDGVNCVTMLSACPAAYRHSQPESGILVPLLAPLALALTQCAMLRAWCLPLRC